MKRKRIIDDRKPIPQEKPYVVEDEWGCHLAAEMFCDVGDNEFEVGDRIVVTNKYKKAYDWFPDLVGQQGTIIDVMTESPVAKLPMDKPVYTVRFDKAFRRGIVAHDELTKWNITEEEWLQEDTNWSFVAEDDEICKST